MILKIEKVDLVTPKNEIKGQELIVKDCPKYLSKVNARKSCAKCPAKSKLSYKKMEVDCRYLKQ